MSKSESSSSSSGIGVCGLLGVAFVVLKLTGVIAWSWWWVTCPFWIGLPVILAIIIVALPIIMIVQARKRNRSNKPGERPETRSGDTR